MCVRGNRTCALRFNIIVPLALFLTVPSCSAFAQQCGSDNFCHVEAMTHEKASALLQVQHEKGRSRVHIDDSTVQGQAATVVDNTSLMTQETVGKGIGATAGFDESGYQAVAATCCEHEMETYVKRLITDLKLILCNEYGLLGLLPWFTCEHGIKSFDSLKANILAGAPPFACAWVADVGQTCKTLGPNCSGQSVPNSHRRRGCILNPTTTEAASTTLETTTVSTTKAVTYVNYDGKRCANYRIPPKTGSWTRKHLTNGNFSIAQCADKCAAAAALQGVSCNMFARKNNGKECMYTPTTDGCKTENWSGWTVYKPA